MQDFVHQQYSLGGLFIQADMNVAVSRPNMQHKSPFAVAGQRAFHWPLILNARMQEIMRIAVTGQNAEPSVQSSVHIRVHADGSVGEAW